MLRSRDTGRLEWFYVAQIGAVVERRQATIGLIQLRVGRSLIDLVPAGADESPGRNLDHFCLRIDPFDPAALTAWFAAGGVAVGAPASRYGAEGEGPSVYLEDPDGNVIELKGPPGPL